MRYAILENTKIINVIEADDLFITKNNLDAVADPDMLASIGGEYIDGEFIPPSFIVTEDAETL